MRPRAFLAAAFLSAACTVGGFSIGVATAAQTADEPSQDKPPGESSEVLGAPSAFDLGATAERRVKVAAGARLHERPAVAAGTLAIVDAAMELPVIERRGDWVRVRYGSFKGWVWKGDGPEPKPEPAPDATTASGDGVGSGTAGGPPADVGSPPGDGASSSPAPRPVARSYTPDPQVVERARRLLGDGARELDVGPWRLLTDVDDARLLASLDRLATELPEAYRELFGLPVDLGGAVEGEDDGASDAGEGTDAPSREMIVLFSREEAYRAFYGEGAALGPDGYTTNGISALYQGDMEDDDLRVLFAHEGVHLLDWRALGGWAPAWLEEGLAQAMAVSRIEPSGALHAKELGDEARVLSDTTGRDGRRETVLRISAGYEAIRRVAEGLRRGDLPTLEELVASGRSALTDPSVRHVRYFQCALFVRYLLEGEDGRWHDGFQGYLADLAGLAQGGDGSPGSLPVVLGTDWETLEQGFAKWVRSRDLRLVGPRRLPERLSQRPARSTGRAAVEVAATEPDPERLARALDLLGHPPGQPLGPWTLYTDVRGRRLLRSLDRLAGETVRAYEDRLGLDPGLPAAGSGAASAQEVVILFARRQEHDAFLGDGALFSAQEIGGSAGFGMAVLQKGERSEEELRALLVHELVHVLSRRALGVRTPPWLEEGLADAMAFSRITPAGGLHARELGGKTETWVGRGHGMSSRFEVQVATTGPRAAIERLVGALDRNALPSLQTLTTMSWDALIDPRRRQLSYAQSALFVRFLLDSDDGRWRQGFRTYLRGIASGNEAAGTPEALLAALGTGWEPLDASFGRWVRSQQIASRMQ